MRAAIRWSFRGLLALLVAASVVGLWKHEEIMRLRAVNSLFDADRIVANFSHMDRAFLSVELPRGNGPVMPLPEGARMDLPDGTHDWIKARAVTSLLVIRDGRIRHESYHLGTDAQDRRISWSIAKSFLSALFGILLDEGRIASLDDPVTRYVPELRGGAYDGTSIRNVLQMTSGVKFDEDYLDHDSDINRMGRVIALGGTMDGFAAGLQARAFEPGETWKYVSIDTHVIGMVIRGATGRGIPSLMSERVIAPIGPERAPYYITDGEGVAFVLGGLNMTTRDYARFGLLYAQGGRIGGRRVVPAAWVTASTRSSAPTALGQAGYGLHWWIPSDGDPGVFMARGIYGQYIYIDRPRGVVIVTTAADRDFREDGVHEANIEMFRRIAESV